MKIGLLILLAACNLSASSYSVIVAGLGGSPEYETQFSKLASELEQSLRANGQDAHIETVSGAAATRQHLQEILERTASAAQPNDTFALVLIGHGTFDGTDYKFNLPGPDISAGDLAAMLNRIPAQRQLVVNTSSASGASLGPLARKGRVVMAATKSGTEKNATVFARYWVDAMRDPSADGDKDGTISALEAFRYAQSKTAAYFETEKMLATEHAVFSENGQATPVREAKLESGQGQAAAAFAVIRPPGEARQNAAPGKQKLFAKKDELEAKIDLLKSQKAATPPDEYKQRLTALLLDLARTQAEIDK